MQPAISFVTPPVLNREVDIAIILLQKEADAQCVHPSIEASAYYHHKEELASMEDYGIYLAQWPKIKAKQILFVVHPELSDSQPITNQTTQACFQQAILATHKLAAKSIAITSLDTKQATYPTALMLPYFITNLHSYLLESNQASTLDTIFIGARDPRVKEGLQNLFKVGNVV